MLYYSVIVAIINQFVATLDVTDFFLKTQYESVGNSVFWKQMHNPYSNAK